MAAFFASRVTHTQWLMAGGRRGSLWSLHCIACMPGSSRAGAAGEDCCGRLRGLGLTGPPAVGSRHRRPGWSRPRIRPCSGGSRRRSPFVGSHARCIIPLPLLSGCCPWCSFCSDWAGFFLVPFEESHRILRNLYIYIYINNKEVKFLPIFFHLHVRCKISSKLKLHIRCKIFSKPRFNIKYVYFRNMALPL
jgi:hypothetical protein